MKVIPLMLCAVLAGCKSAPEVRPFVAPTIIEVPVTKYVPLPEGLTRPCPLSKAKTRKVGDVVDAYNRNVLSLTQCNKQLDAIRGLAQ